MYHNVTNRVHLTCTPGSVGTRGGQPPWVTRPKSDADLDQEPDDLLAVRLV